MKVEGNRRAPTRRCWHATALASASAMALLAHFLTTSPAGAAPRDFDPPDIYTLEPERHDPARKVRKPYSRMDRRTAYLAHVCRRIEIEAKKRGLPPGFFARLIWTESRFDRDAISPKGARGIAQFMPGTAKIRKLADPFDAKSALSASAHYLGELHLEFGNLGRAAAAYNSGEGRVRRWLGGKTGLPRETEDYVFVITGFTSDNWNAEELPEADFTLDENLTLQQACRQLPVRRAPPQPRYAYAHNNQGVVYVKSGQLERAIAHYDRAIQIRPRFAKAFFNRAIAHRKAGNLEQAIQDYASAIRFQPNYPEAYNNRGVAYQRSGEIDRAIADYTKAIRFNPKFASALHNRAVAFRKKGNFAKSIADLTLAIRLRPAYAQAFANRGVTYEQAGQRNKAIADFRSAIKIQPKHRLAMLGLKRLGVTP